MKQLFSIAIMWITMSACAEVPTITIGVPGASTSLTNPTYYPASSSLFSFPGTRTASTNILGTNYYYSIGNSASPGKMMPMKIAFDINAKEFEVLCSGGYPAVMVYNPPDYTPFTNALSSPANYYPTWVRVQFAKKTNHTVIFYLSGSQGNYIGGVNLEQGDTIATNTLGPRKKLEVLGDSYTEGYNQDQSWSRWLGGYCMALERLLTNVDVIPDGEGGTGFLNNGPSPGETNYAGRFFSDVVSNNPDFLLIQGSVNDTGLLPSNTVYYAAVTNLFALAKANLPNCKIGSIGVFYYTGPSSYNPAPAASTNYSLLTGLAATNYGFPFVDPIAGGWLNSSNYTLISSDSVHPTVALYAQYATNLYHFVTNAFALSGGSSPPASATFSASPTNGLAPLTVNFTYTGSNGTAFSWAFGDGGSSTLRNPSYTYNSNGTYSVSLVVNGNTTNTQPSLVTVTGSSTNVASATFTTAPSIGAVPLSVNFTYTGSNGTAFSWTFGDGGSSTLRNPSYIYTASGTYQATLQVNGNATNTRSSVITVTNSSVNVTNLVLNVTNYGAVGDAVQFYVNTTSNSAIVTTTNHLSSAAIGDSIEVFQVGPRTYGINSYNTNAYGNQDLVATITNIVNGTNIYMSRPAQATLTNAFATYGHNNQTNFQAAIAAASAVTNAVINIPAGVYLLLASSNSAYGYAGLILSAGGITFNGAGTNATTLLGEGAWTLQQYPGSTNAFPTRGFLIEENPPIKNNYPVVFENMTLDGGVQQGNTSTHGIQANPVDGLGWDETHDAFLVWSYNNTNAINRMTWTNLVFQHWRGEMVKSIDQSTNGNLDIFNCVFNDGNATAINIYPSLNISNCVFQNLFQVAEYYQAYSSNTNYFQNNLVTNITGNGFAINGGKGNNPPFIIRNNTFYLIGNGNNGIETVPADNVSIISNQFICRDYANAIVLGASGYQGTYDNSNIVIAANTVVNPYTFVEICGATNAISTQRVESVSVYGNVLTQPNHSVTLLQTYGWTTNIHFWSNDCSTIPGSIAVSSGNYGSIYSLMDTNNRYNTCMYDYAGITNYISYGTGSMYAVIYAWNPKSVYALQDSDALQIPPGAEMVISNATSNPAGTFPVYLNSALSRGPLNLTNGQSVAFQWTNGAWQLATAGFAPAPPIDFHVVASTNAP